MRDHIAIIDVELSRVPAHVFKLLIGKFRYTVAGGIVIVGIRYIGGDQCLPVAACLDENAILVFDDLVVAAQDLRDALRLRLAQSRRFRGGCLSLENKDLFFAVGRIDDISFIVESKFLIGVDRFKKRISLNNNDLFVSNIFVLDFIITILKEILKRHQLSSM